MSNNAIQSFTALLAAIAANPARTSALSEQAAVNAGQPDPFAALLPRETSDTWRVGGGNLRMVVTPALPVAPDSPLPQGGQAVGTAWSGETDKWGLRFDINEVQMKELHEALFRAAGQGGATGLARTGQEYVRRLLGQVNESLNLSERIVRAEAIMSGRYTGRASVLGAKAAAKIGSVDYGVKRFTAAGAYDGPTSSFWADIAKGRREAGTFGVTIVTSEATYLAAKTNSANAIAETARVENANGTITVTISQMPKVSDGHYNTTPDAEFANVQITLIRTQAYQVVGADGKLNAVKYGVDNVLTFLPSGVLGGLIIAPTVEGQRRGVNGGSRCTYIAEPSDTEISVRGVTNMLPVIYRADEICVFNTGTNV